MFRFHLCLLFLAALVPLGSAQTPTKGPASQASLVSEAKTIAPGATFSVALKLKHPTGWHSYYKNTGGVELPPSIKWTLPDGFSAGAIQWPAPEAKDGYFGKSFVYSGSPVFLVDLTAPDTLESGKTATLEAEAFWQICDKSCISEKQSFTLNLTVGTSVEKDPAHVELFAKARASLPANKENWKFSATSEGGDIVLHVKLDDKQAALPKDFIPNEPFVKAASDGGGIQSDGDAWLIRLKRNAKDALDNDIPQETSFSGVLIGTTPIAVPLTPIMAESRPPVPLPAGKYLAVLGGMLLGGLILNLMPCVFPVIGLKIMGFVQQAGADRRKIVLHGITFALGVLASFGTLSGILFAARAAAGGGAESIGWGYQLQNPWVVLSLMLLMFVLALNMFGVFELGTSATSVGGSLQAKQGLAGSFFSGVLATVVATPCSAPFLGAAIGAAIALPAFQFFAAFAAMAIGLALPYLILSAFPKLIDFLPRPGAWMESFKQAMSFLLFATAGYLLWVYAGIIDADNLLGPIFGLSAIAIAAWIHGRWNLPHKKPGIRFAATACTLAFAIAGFLLAKPPKPSSLDWQPWTLETQETLLKEGKPVFIDFTAKWCATCQVNKKRAYTREVVDLLHKKGVTTLKADKTKPNPEIEQALQKYGRSAIPVNVLLAPGKEPVILPELLSPKDMLDALNKL